MAELLDSPLTALRVMATPRRWRLLAELGAGDRRVGELTELLGEPQSLVSYHLGELRAAGLVSSRRSSYDGRDAYYRLNLTRCGEVLCAAGVALDPALVLAPADGRTAPTAARPSRRKPRVLFLCTGNSARSQMAEALLEHRTAGAIEARSAGSHPRPVHPGAVRAMADRGIDISGRASKHFASLGRTRFDRVITLCDKVREVCPELPGHPTASHWSIPDPAGPDDHGGGDFAAFALVADDLEGRIRSLIARLTTAQGGICACLISTGP